MGDPAVNTDILVAAKHVFFVGFDVATDGVVGAVFRFATHLNVEQIFRDVFQDGFANEKLIGHFLLFTRFFNFDGEKNQCDQRSRVEFSQIFPKNSHIWRANF